MLNTLTPQIRRDCLEIFPLNSACDTPRNDKNDRLTSVSAYKAQNSFLKESFDFGSVSS